MLPPGNQAHTVTSFIEKHQAAEACACGLTLWPHVGVASGGQCAQGRHLSPRVRGRGNTAFSWAHVLVLEYLSTAVFAECMHAKPCKSSYRYLKIKT